MDISEIGRRAAQANVGSAFCERETARRLTVFTAQLGLFCLGWLTAASAPKAPCGLPSHA